MAVPNKKSRLTTKITVVEETTESKTAINALLSPTDSSSEFEVSQKTPRFGSDNDVVDHKDEQMFEFSDEESDVDEGVLYCSPPNRGLSLCFETASNTTYE